MNNAEIIQAFREEIARLQPNAPKPGNMKSVDAKVAMQVHARLNKLLSFLSDLEKSEKPMNQEGLEEEIERYLHSLDVGYGGWVDGMEDDDLRGIARHFYDLGCRRTAEKYDELEYNRQRASGSSEIPKDLEEAAWKYAGEHSFHPCDYDVTPYDCFIDGAEWQADHAPLPEDTVLFNKGVEEGKRMMMEEAVEIGTTEICWVPDGDRVFPTFDPPVEDLLMPGIMSQRFNGGDKVRVIIVKEN